MRDVLLLAQDGAARRFGGMRGEHRLDAHGCDQLQRLRPASRPSRCRRAMQSAMPPGCGTLESLRYCAAAAHAMRLLGRIHRLEPDRERACKIGGRRRRPALRCVPATPSASAASPSRRRIAASRSPSTSSQELLAPLVAQRLADQFAERMHILAQGRVLDRKLNALAIHIARLWAIQRRNFYELVGADRYISRRGGHRNPHLPILQARLGARLSGRRHHHRARRSRADQQDRHHSAYRASSASYC